MGKSIRLDRLRLYPPSEYTIVHSAFPLDSNSKVLVLLVNHDCEPSYAPKPNHPHVNLRVITYNPQNYLCRNTSMSVRLPQTPLSKPPLLPLLHLHATMHSVMRTTIVR